MRYAEYLPSPSFSALVERFWLLEGAAVGAADAIIPDGRVELIFHYGAPFWRHEADGRVTKQPASLLVGQMMEPVLLAPQGVAGVAAIRLRPAAARSLLRFPLQEVSGRFVDLDALFPALPSLCDRLAEGPDDAARIRTLEEWLRERTRLSVRPHVEGIVGAIIRSGGRAPIDVLAAQSGNSLRQLERHFRDDVGLTPKALSRIVRLQSALKLVRQGRALTQVALECGFYDQAHMTRDFREIAAMSPGAWQSHAGDLAPLFVAT